MNIPGIVVPAFVYAFWVVVSLWVYKASPQGEERARRGTLSIYTFGIWGVAVLVGGKDVENVFSPFLKKVAGVFGLGTAAASPKDELPSIQLIAHDGHTPDYDRISASDAIEVVRETTMEAIEQRATDIHLEPEGGQLRVRYRIDGVLQEARAYPGDMTRKVVSALKVLGGLDVAERRRGQDGSFMAQYKGRHIDFRVATAGTSHGEALVLRILDRAVALRSLDELGLSSTLYKQFQRIVHAPHGMLLVCGPTGSGKSTTLYAALQEVDTHARNVITIEDPIEYEIEGVKQYSINPKAGIQFANLLRNVLRQDPDVLMVGEIRDADTAEIAMQASQTGHFVYSTLHANDSIAAVFRLFDLDVPAYLVSSSVTAVLAQRLVRRLCEECKVPTMPSQKILDMLHLEPDKAQFFEPGGCEKCRDTGYYGRTGVFEMLIFEDEIRQLVRETAGLVQLRRTAREAGYVPMKVQGLAKAATGVTSLKEVLRVTQ
jgi:type II secretory ATPase GspE/PulE/Tfp pilus assembly ATPase PilB-like protein